MVQSFNDAVDGLRVAVGPGKVLQYTLQVRDSQVNIFLMQRVTLVEKTPAGMVVE